MNMRTLLECYKILEEYPNGMTKDQFYRVARINKQHAKYLLIPVSFRVSIQERKHANTILRPTM